MTENEILNLKDKMKSNMNVYFYDDVMKVFDELLAYRAIGTIEELQALKEKNEPKMMDGYYCPICRHYFEVGELHLFCPCCGQALDWE